MRETIFDKGCCFEFFQALRVLRKLYPDREPVGYSAHPSREVARFGANITLSFPASQIQETSLGDGEDPQPQVRVNFMGLTGPLGVLPQHYTELLLRRIYEKDYALRDFLDLFNHRFISFFYRAWEKYRYQIAYESGKEDRFTHYLSDLIGMGTPGLQNRLAVEDQGLLLYAGLFNQQPHSASGLEGILRDYFGLPVEVRQYEGRWIRLGLENQTSLGIQNCTLGVNAICGERVWDRQSKFRICVGPLKLESFSRFLPGGPAYNQLSHLTRLYAGLEYDFDVQLILQSSEVPACQLLSDTEGVAHLGWSSWLKIREFTQNAADTILACNN